MKKSLILLCMTFVFAVFVGCGGGVKVGENGKLVIYSPSSEEQVTTIIAAFEEKTGVKVELVSVVTGEMFKRIKSEKNAPYGDIAWGGVDSIYRENLDLFEEYVSVNNGELPKQFQNIAKKVTIYCLDGSVLLVNKDLIGNIKVAGYKDLLNPALKNKMIMADPSNSASAFAHIINMLLAVGGDFSSQEGWDYIKNLLIQINGKIGNSSGVVHKGAADGEYAVAITYEDPSVTYVRNKAPVEVVYMEEGVIFNTSAMGIIKGGKNLENAKKFIDYVTSKEAQDIYGTKLTARPIRADAKLGSYMKPFSEIKIIYPNYDEIEKNRTKILNRYKAIFTEVNK